MSAVPAFLPPLPACQAGDKLGVWRLQRMVGQVPSGHWWRAQHSLSGVSAWVLVYSHVEDAGAVLLRVAQAEGEPWQYPDLAWPLDSGLTGDGRPYVVMPPVEGEPLMAANPKASLRRRLGWVVQLCELLLLAEQAGLSLIELDPSLLWLGPQQQLRLFGLALVRKDATVLRLGALQGQISLAAQDLRCPQSAQGSPADRAAQVFTVGSMMGLLVNGRLPQRLESLEAPVPVLSQWLALKPDSREQLTRLLGRVRHADANQRPASLADLAQEIEQWLDASGGLASTEAGALAARRIVEAPKPAPAPVALPPSPVEPERPIWPWVVAGGLILGVALLSLLMLRTH
ncbi:hypothetical protein HNQ51_003113 [Inhella inkyongensis]|uniref:Protein kinase domain-containing protein n=1 Tax=Inhella inkyongensis TaxID=392593 RepID=A0A840S9V8_9BURK|nr:hypothetical protein [Inhella inkyongensis]MBB5205786.1 hypothetical protein [Inhella inkyongensis]